jgi:hypothetical protein
VAAGWAGGVIGRDTGPVTTTQKRRTATVTTTQERRTAAVALGLLAATLLVAGVLPWATGGPLPVRLIAVPLLLLGGLAGVTAARLPTGPLPRRPVPAPASRPPHRCTRCAAPAPTDPPGQAGGSPQPI